MQLRFAIKRYLKTKPWHKIAIPNHRRVLANFNIRPDSDDAVLEVYVITTFVEKLLDNSFGGHTYFFKGQHARTLL